MAFLLALNLDTDKHLSSTPHFKPPLIVPVMVTCYFLTRSLLSVRLALSKNTIASVIGIATF